MQSNHPGFLDRAELPHAAFETTLYPPEKQKARPEGRTFLNADQGLP